jgi:hypothetical protein
VGCAIGKVSMEAVSKSIMIFYIPMLVVLGLVTYVPALTLWFPSLFNGESGPVRDRCSACPIFSALANILHVGRAGRHCHTDP